MPHIVSVRYGMLDSTGVFTTPLTDLVEKDEVVVHSDRGTEMGVVLGAPTEVAETPADIVGEVLRRRGPEDNQCSQCVEATQVQSELRYCRQKIRELKLPMKLVNVEHLVGADKIVFYFIAEGRVDFRELVKDLAREYRTRIELKQIGVCDEAKLLADQDHCGREICCRSWMRRMEPVTMKMAKAQKATLDPAKISGRCGRLMCCLRFEDTVYEDLKKNLPRKGQQVVLADGTAEVINYDILSQTLTVEYHDGRRLRVRLAEVTKVLPREPQNEGAARSSGPRRSSELVRPPRHTSQEPQPAEEHVESLVAERRVEKPSESMPVAAEKPVEKPVEKPGVAEPEEKHIEDTFGEGLREPSEAPGAAEEGEKH